MFCNFSSDLLICIFSIMLITKSLLSLSEMQIKIPGNREDLVILIKKAWLIPILSIVFVILSYLLFSPPINLIYIGLDFFFRLLISVSLSTLIYYLCYIFRVSKKFETNLFINLTLFLIAIVTINSTVIHSTIVENDKISFEDGVKGLLYIWDNETGHQKCLFLYAGDHQKTQSWKARPVEFIVSFNPDVYAGCRISNITFKKGFFKEINQQNEHKISFWWNEDDMCDSLRNTYFNRFVEFEVYWDSNQTYAKPDNYSIRIRHFSTNRITDVCVGIAYFSPIPKDSVQWFEKDMPKIESLNT